MCIFFNELISLSVWNLQDYGFVPQTYILPYDFKLLKRTWDDGGSRQKWILKPVIWLISFLSTFSKLDDQLHSVSSLESTVYLSVRDKTCPNIRQESGYQLIIMCSSVFRYILKTTKWNHNVHDCTSVSLKIPLKLQPASARGIGIRVIHKWNQIPRKRPVIVQRYSPLFCQQYVRVVWNGICFARKLSV